jgi:hypothetical protein
MDGWSVCFSTHRLLLGHHFTESPLLLGDLALPASLVHCSGRVVQPSCVSGTLLFHGTSYQTLHTPLTCSLVRCPSVACLVFHLHRYAGDSHGTVHLFRLESAAGGAAGLKGLTHAAKVSILPAHAPPSHIVSLQHQPFCGVLGSPMLLAAARNGTITVLKISEVR